MLAYHGISPSVTRTGLPAGVTDVLVYLARDIAVGFLSVRPSICHVVMLASKRMHIILFD